MSLIAAAFFIGFGGTYFEPSSDGNWWQSPFPHSLDTQSPSLQVGYRTEPGCFLGGRCTVSIDYLGDVSSHALATASDADFHDGPPYWPLSTWIGEGRSYGIAMTAEHEVYGSLSVEYGAFVYNTEWEMIIPDWRACETCEPQFLKVKARPQRSFSPIIGLRYELSDQWSAGVSYRSVKVRGSDWISVARGPAYSLFFRYEF